jgi:hypothetical protein
MTRPRHVAEPIAGSGLPSYVQTFLALYAAGELHKGEAYTIDVYHDDDCPLLAGRGPCDCNPDIEMHRLPEEQE